MHAVDAVDEDLRRFLDFTVGEGLATGLDHATVVRESRRDELGISSLSIILLVVRYMEVQGAGDLVFRPEWVARLESVEGVIAVMREVDRAAGREAVT